MDYDLARTVAAIAIPFLFAFFTPFAWSTEPAQPLRDLTVAVGIQCIVIGVFSWVLVRSLTLSPEVISTDGKYMGYVALTSIGSVAGWTFLIVCSFIGAKEKGGRHK